jgi:hypothetical protein
MSLGGDLQMLSSPQIESNSRGNQLGHAVLRSILGAGGRSSALVIVEAAPLLRKGVPGGRHIRT